MLLFRKIVFFLFGFCLPFCIYSLSFADDACYDPQSVQASLQPLIGSKHVTGDNSLQMVADSAAAIDASGYWAFVNGDGDQATKSTIESSTIVFDGCTYNYLFRVYWGYPANYMMSAAYTDCAICDDDEPKYFIESECVCSETGEHIYLSYGKCSDSEEMGQVPDGDITVVGRMDLFTAIHNEDVVLGLTASCSTGGGSCGFTWDDIQSMIESVGSGSDCGIKYNDDDGDGVSNDDDDCPGTSAGDPVDQFGCSLPDSDGDGVSDDDDLCPGTLIDTLVDSFGCPDDDSSDPDAPDSDGDGVPDIDDTCPGTVSGGTVGPDGCVPPVDPLDGDNDDDAELLTDISGWLSNIYDENKKIKIGVNDLNGTTKKILDTEKIIAVKSQKILDENKLTNKTLDSIEENLDSLLVKTSYDSTSTNNLTAFVPKETVLTAIGSKYSTRFTSFIDIVKGSELFSLPFGIFSSFTTSTVSAKTISIGSWGGGVDQNVTVDMADYNSIWDSLRSIILMLVAYAAFKIVVVKHA